MLGVVVVVHPFKPTPRWLWCMYGAYMAHAWNKNQSPPQWSSCRIYSTGNRVIVYVWVSEREKRREGGGDWQKKADVKDKCFPVLLVTPSLLTAFTSLSPSFFLSPASFLQSLAPFLSLPRRGLVSPWPVGTEKQPQWLEVCSSTTTRGRSSSLESTEMT